MTTIDLYYRWVSVSCPTCEAVVGEPCISPRKGKTHVVRQDKAERARYRNL